MIVISVKVKNEQDFIEKERRLIEEGFKWESKKTRNFKEATRIGVACKDEHFGTRIVFSNNHSIPKHVKVVNSIEELLSLYTTLRILGNWEL